MGANTATSVLSLEHIDGLEHRLKVNVDILFRGRKPRVTHDLLNDTGRDMLKGKGCRGCMTAGIGCEAATTGTLQDFVISVLEPVFIDADQLIALRVFA